MSSKQSKPSIVLVHGIWADGSSFRKLIPGLQADGHEVIAAQYGLDTLAGDVAAVRSQSEIASPFETLQPGIFAVGDVRAESVKRVASAVGEGSVVIQWVHRYLGQARRERKQEAA